eukprot:Mrub_07994.p1 GENE.Mrub_07994~~Mrub_07994.p1  ORF type:complete len:251 (+),score=59.52 Mrub_07994:42-755(+)
MLKEIIKNYNQKFNEVHKKAEKEHLELQIYLNELNINQNLDMNNKSFEIISLNNELKNNNKNLKDNIENKSSAISKLLIYENFYKNLLGVENELKIYSHREILELAVIYFNKMKRKSNPHSNFNIANDQQYAPSMMSIYNAIIKAVNDTKIKPLNNHKCLSQSKIDELNNLKKEINNYKNLLEETKVIKNAYLKYYIDNEKQTWRSEEYVDEGNMKRSGSITPRFYKAMRIDMDDNY